MSRSLSAILLGSLLLPLAPFAARAADLDYGYAPPPPPYQRPVVIEERPVMVEQPVIYPRPYPIYRPYAFYRPYPIYRPYPRFVRRFPPPFYGPDRRFADRSFRGF